MSGSSLRHCAGKYDFQTGSDCEVILALYRDKGPDFLEELSGIFAFALYDAEKDALLIARVIKSMGIKMVLFPSEASVACSTAVALEWDAAFKDRNDPSGRAVAGVHEQAY